MHAGLSAVKVLDVGLPHVPRPGDEPWAFVEHLLESAKRFVGELFLRLRCGSEREYGVNDTESEGIERGGLLSPQQECGLR